ncbi:uncharacterized protein SOCE26_031690 [Sorangium cellulosum]|uniref:Uncharacterized protein n=2 Tax=Sorangium cellulosum TaxID=56 RepID=A0A2L0ER29_SORCE|nr:uncharacterized protein SOCE26_031690 [Sorangium cellulosum]
MIAPEGEHDGARIFEDGFGLLLTRASWTRLRTALASHAPLTLPGTGGLMDFTRSWVDEVYHNPIDGRAYVASEGWRTYLHQEATGTADASKVRAVKSTAARARIAKEHDRDVAPTSLTPARRIHGADRLGPGAGPRRGVSTAWTAAVHRVGAGGSAALTACW